MSKYNRVLKNNKTFKMIAKSYDDNTSLHEKITYSRVHKLKRWQMKLILIECNCFINSPHINMKRQGNIITLIYPNNKKGWYKAL